MAPVSGPQPRGPSRTPHFGAQQGSQPHPSPVKAVWSSGFENQVAAYTNAGAGLANTVTGTIGAATDQFRSGAASLKYQAAGAGACIDITAVGSPSVMVSRSYHRFNALPTGADAIIVACLVGLQNCDIILTTGGVLQAKVDTGTAVSGPTINTGQWYRIDARFDLTRNPTLISWQVDGVDQTSATLAQAATTISSYRLGVSTATAATLTGWIDDAIISTTASDYPIGDGYSKIFIPNGKGTHVPGAGAFQSDAAAAITDANDAAGQSWLRLDEQPPSATDFITQTAADSTGYLEYALTDAAEGNAPNSVSVWFASHAASAASCDISIKTNDNGTITAGSTNTMALTSEFYSLEVLARRPSTGLAWTEDAVSNLLLRAGFAVDATPNPRIDAVWVEVDYAGVAPSGAANQTVNAPAATATASGPTPTVQLEVDPAAATASASATVPVMPIVAPVATASASAPLPTVQLQVSPAAATASASAPPPTPQLSVVTPAATASASAPVPTVQLKVSPAAATATASAPNPVMPIVVPVATASANSPPATPQLQLTPAAATASASAPLPTLKLQVSPAAATATGSAPTPVMPIVAPVATASASAPTPTLQDKVSPGADTATGSAPTPGVDVKVSPVAATASASAPVPAVSAGTTLFPPVATASASASSLTDWTPTTGAWLLSNVNLTGSDADWATREAALGRTFSGRMKYKTITTTTLSDLNVGDLFASVAYPTAGGLSFSGNNTIPSINAGSQDANLIAFANAVKAITPTRVFLRLFWEFNLAGNRFNPANYVDSGGVAAPGAWADFQSAWVRVWTIFFGTAGDFTAQGISGTPPACSHDQVKFAYNPNKKGGSSPVDPTLGYPGSQYVDWIFLDSYPNRVSGANEVLDSPTILVTKPSVSGAVDWYNTFSSYGKPLGIGETSVHPVDDSTTIYGSGNGVSPVTRGQWWSLWVSALQAMPLIRLVTFFDANDATWPGSGHTWQTDAASATTGDSGSQAFTAYSTFANDAYVKPLASAGLGVTVPPAAATASASAPTPTVTAVTANQTVSPPAATATASAPTPTPALKVPPAAGTTSASAPTPTISVALTVSAPAATASATATAPTLALRLSPPAATASASSPGPSDGDTVLVPAASASASAPVPTLSLPVGGFVIVPLVVAVASAPTPKIHHIFFDIAELWHHHENGLGEYPIAPGLSLNTAELFNQRYRDNSKDFPVTGDSSLTVDLEKLWDQKYRDTSVPFPVDQL